MFSKHLYKYKDESAKVLTALVSDWWTIYGNSVLDIPRDRNTTCLYMIPRDEHKLYGNGENDIKSK